MPCFRPLRRVVLVVALLCTCLLGVQRHVLGATFPANHPAIFYSPWNWSLSPGGGATTNEPGAYFQFTVSGSQNITLNLDLNGIQTLDSSNYMFVQWTVDGVLTQAVPITMQSHQLALASRLKPGKHIVRVWYASAKISFDRWSASALLADGSKAPPQSFRLSGITLDPGATLLANAGLQPHRIVFYGDSITEGYLLSPFHDATQAYPNYCAAQLHAEFGIIGNSGQGWTVLNASSNQVPLFLDSWNYYYRNTPRFPRASADGLLDYILVNMGDNDGLSKDAASPARHTLATQNAVAFLAGIRAANPQSKIFLVAPFSGFYAQSMQSAVDQYNQTHPQDHGVFLIDLGWSAQAGLTNQGPSPQSYDGQHPNLATSRALGFQLAAALQTTLGQYDFLGTGRSDLILQNTTTGRIAFQSPTDSGVGAKSYVTSLPAAGYQVVGSADFNGDGKPDLVFQNRATGAIAVWYMVGVTTTGGATVSVKAPIGWQVVGVGDIDNDGQPDLALQNSVTRQIVIWYMNGTAVHATASLTQIPAAGYQVVGMADANRDGKLDLFFQSPASGQLVVWYMDGDKFLGGVTIPQVVPSGYHVEGVADFYGDGRADLALRNSAGALQIWRPAEGSCLVGTFTAPRLDPSYRIAGPR